MQDSDAETLLLFSTHLSATIATATTATATIATATTSQYNERQQL